MNDEKEGLTEQDKVKEKIRLNTEKFRLSIIALITIGGGTISLINVSANTAVDSFFIAWGLLLSIGCGASGYNFYNDIKRLIK